MYLASSCWGVLIVTSKIKRLIDINFWWGGEGGIIRITNGCLEITYETEYSKMATMEDSWTLCWSLEMIGWLFTGRFNGSELNSMVKWWNCSSFISAGGCKWRINEGVECIVSVAGVGVVALLLLLLLLRVEIVFYKSSGRLMWVSTRDERFNLSLSKAWPLLHFQLEEEEEEEEEVHRAAVEEEEAAAAAKKKKKSGHFHLRY